VNNKVNIVTCLTLGTLQSELANYLSKPRESAAWLIVGMHKDHRLREHSGYSIVISAVNLPTYVRQHPYVWIIAPLF
jgi:hypothetical protein